MRYHLVYIWVITALLVGFIGEVKNGHSFTGNVIRSVLTDTEGSN